MLLRVVADHVSTFYDRGGPSVIGHSVIPIAASCRITCHLTQLQSSHAGFLSMTMSLVYSNGLADVSPKEKLWATARTRGEQNAGVCPHGCADKDDSIMSKWTESSEDFDPKPQRIKVVQDPTGCWHDVPDKAPDEILLKGSNLIIQLIYPSICHKTIFTAVPALCLPATGLIIQLFVALMSSAKWFLSAPSEALSRISSDGSI